VLVFFGAVDGVHSGVAGDGTVSIHCEPVLVWVLVSCFLFYFEVLVSCVLCFPALPVPVIVCPVPDCSFPSPAVSHPSASCLIASLFPPVSRSPVYLVCVYLSWASSCLYFPCTSALCDILQSKREVFFTSPRLLCVSLLLGLCHCPRNRYRTWQSTVDLFSQPSSLYTVQVRLRLLRSPLTSFHQHSRLITAGDLQKNNPFPLFYLFFCDWYRRITKHWNPEVYSNSFGFRSFHYIRIRQAICTLKYNINKGKTCIIISS